MDGVWLPAGEENTGARGFPDSRHTFGPGIAKGEAFSPLARRRSPEVNRTAMFCKAETEQVVPADDAGDVIASFTRNTLGFAQLSPTYYQSIKTMR